MNDTVLYVDDYQDNLEVFELLFGTDFTVLTASSGERALELLRQREVAVMLVDQRMPGMSGTELMTLVAEEFPDTERILITAYSDLDAAIDAINRAHVRCYLRKPWDEGLLRAVLQEGITAYNRGREARSLERRLLEVERVYSLGMVSAGIAHELRNPITVLVGGIEVAIEELKRVQSEAADDASVVAGRLEQLGGSLDDIRSSAERIAEIVRAIELPTRRRDPCQDVDLREVVELTLKMVEFDLRRTATLSLELGKVPPVKASANRLGQVVLNLLVNAMQAFNDARARSRNRVTVRLSNGDNGVRLDIEDNGRGIPPEHRARVFDPFFTTRAEGGTGLGLAISREIVSELGGLLELRSQDEGTCFSVWLPARHES